MARASRVKAIRRIERLRKSRIITYICSDRQGAAAQISEDAIRPMYDHLRTFGEVERLDLYLYSRGGLTEVPWRVVSMLREHCQNLGVLIPFRAHSAATLIALGCDEIVMTKKAELGPIDPSMGIRRVEGGTAVEEQVQVEDVMSYVGLLKDRAGVTDQAAIAAHIRLLAEKLSPWLLGSMYRTHAHVRMVAKRMLGCHRTRLDENQEEQIIKVLAEEIHSHGHAIGRSEAKDLGLPVVASDPDLEEAMWQLLEEYEELMEMRRPIDTENAFPADADVATIPLLMASVESRVLTWAFRGVLRLLRVRQAPAQFNINMNLGIALPPGLDPHAVPQDLLNQIIQNAQNQIPDLVREQVRRQSPILKSEGRIDAFWQDVTAEGL